MALADDFQQAFYAGIGFAVKGKEKIEEEAKKFADKNQMNAEEGKKFIDDIVKKSEEARNNLSKQIEENVQKAVDKAGFVTSDDIKKLEARIADLEKQKKSNG